MTEQAISAQALQNQAAAYKERYHTLITEMIVPGLKAAGAAPFGNALLHFHNAVANPLGVEPEAMELHGKTRVTAANFTEICLPAFAPILGDACRTERSMDSNKPLSLAEKAKVRLAYYVVKDFLGDSGFSQDYTALQRNAAIYREQSEPQPATGSRQAAAARITAGSQISVLANEQA